MPWPATLASLDTIDITDEARKALTELVHYVAWAAISDPAL